MFSLSSSPSVRGLPSACTYLVTFCSGSGLTTQSRVFEEIMKLERRDIWVQQALTPCHGCDRRELDFLCGLAEKRGRETSKAERMER